MKKFFFFFQVVFVPFSAECNDVPFFSPSRIRRSLVSVLRSKNFFWVGGARLLFWWLWWPLFFSFLSGCRVPCVRVFARPCGLLPLMRRKKAFFCRLGDRPPLFPFRLGSRVIFLPCIEPPGSLCKRVVPFPLLLCAPFPGGFATDAGVSPLSDRALTARWFFFPAHLPHRQPFPFSFFFPPPPPIKQNTPLCAKSLPSFHSTGWTIILSGARRSPFPWISPFSLLAADAFPRTCPCFFFDKR